MVDTFGPGCVGGAAGGIPPAVEAEYIKVSEETAVGSTRSHGSGEYSSWGPQRLRLFLRPDLLSFCPVNIECIHENIRNLIKKIF